MELQNRKNTWIKAARKARRKRRFLRTVVVVIGMLAIIRIALPFVALRLINKKLSSLPDYVCHIEDLDLNLMGGSITLRGIEMKKKNGKIALPFFKCNAIHVKVESLKHRASGIVVDSCIMNLVKGKSKATSQLSLDEAWIELAKEMPLKPNSLVVNAGEVHYRELYKHPDIDLAMKSIRIAGSNLENLQNVKDTLPSLVTLAAVVEGARLNTRIRLDQTKPEVSSVMTLSPVQLRSFNDILRSYTKFDVERGTLSLYAEFNLKKNRISGYGKPVVRDLVLFDAQKDKEKPFGKRVTEALIQTGANIFKKKQGKEDKITARVEFSGTISNPKLNVWQIILSGLFDSVGQSVKKGLENPVNPQQEQ